MFKPPAQLARLQRRFETFAVDATSPARRILGQIEYAAGLAELHDKAAWRKHVAKACDAVDQALAGGRLRDLSKLVKTVEDILSPLAKTAKKYTVHCVGHAHIDMNWMWSWPETVASTCDTFLTVLRLMDEFDDFCFTQSQASVYDIVRKYAPEMMDRIRQRVAEGRWEVAAVHWVEGDKNLASGASLARHLLYTRRFFAEQFDLSPEDVPLDWEPDTFGHAHTIPTILARGGVTRYYGCRMGETDRPAVFWWQGPDGSRVLVSQEQTWYNDTIHPQNARGMLEFARKTGLSDWMLVYGIGDHGGGPTRRDIRMCYELDAWPIFPSFKMATSRDYYANLEKHADQHPVVDEELNYEFTGCYTSQSLIKKINRLGELYCLQAEWAGVLGERAGGVSYPADMLREAWIPALFCHFHDILPGSGVAATRRYQDGMFQEAAAATGMVQANAFRAIAAKVDMGFAAEEATAKVPADREDRSLGAGVGRGTGFGGISSVGHADGTARGLVVFNPTAWDRSETVTVSVWDSEETDARSRAFAAVYPDGSRQPLQRIEKGHFWGHGYVDLAVPVTVPAMGYAAFAVVEEGTVERPVLHSHGYEKLEVKETGAVRNQTSPRALAGDHVGPWAMDNEHVEVHFDKTTGCIRQLIDKASGRELMDAAAGEQAGLEYVLERPRGMSAWIIQPARQRVCPLDLESFEPTLFGPTVAGYEAKYKINDSTVTVHYRLRQGARFVEVKIDADWREVGAHGKGIPALRFQLPLALTGAVGRYETPFGWIERPLNEGQEVPSQRWADVTGKIGNAKAGCAVLNDCKYGHSLNGSTLRVTLLRSSFDPDPLPEMGSHEMTLALAPHDGSRTPDELIRLGAGFNQPLQVVSSEIATGGQLPVEARGAEVSPASVILSTLKKAEAGDGVIVHVYETAGKAATAKVAIDPALIGEVTDAVEVDLLERPVESGSAKATADGFSVKVPARGIAAVKLTLAD